MANKTEICNLALSNIGISQFIAAIDTDRTNEAIVCRRWYDVSVEFVLADYDWYFSRRRQAMALLGITPPSEWLYVYAYPSDCLAIRRLQNPGIRQPTAAQRIPFEPGGETVGNSDIKVIYTNQVDAVAVFSKLITDPMLFTPHVVLGLGYILAANIALPLAVKPAYVDQMRNAYLQMISNAAARNFEESEEGSEPESETFVARNGY